MNLGFTGTRRVSHTQEQQARTALVEIKQQHPGAIWHVGDAPGLDALVRATNPEAVIYIAQGRKAWELQQRSRKMVEAIGSGILYAFPNKLCPPELSPNHCDRWFGSGTWGTVAYAVSLGVSVAIVPLVENLELPAWTTQQQLSLF
jgi:hypothetical protein